MRLIACCARPAGRSRNIRRIVLARSRVAESECSPGPVSDGTMPGMAYLSSRRIALLCAAAALAVSLPTLRNGFAIDDIHVFVDQPSIRDLGHVGSFFASGWGTGSNNVQEQGLNTNYYRPLPTTLSAVEYALFGLRPVGFHLTSALLHAAASVLAALILWQLTARQAAVTLIGGLLFAVHPASSEAYAAACYQTVLLAGSLGLLCLLLFGRILQKGASPMLLAGLGFALLGALLSKEEAFAIPLLAVAWAVLLRPPGWRRSLALASAAMAAPTLVVLGLRAAFVRPSAITYFGNEPAGVVALTMVRVQALYAELLLLPLRLCPFYDWFVIDYQRGLSAGVATGAGILLACAVAFIYSVRRRPLLALAIAWYFLALLPGSQIVSIIVVAAERFLYLPMLGISLAAGLLFSGLIERARAAGWRRLPMAAIAVVVLLLGARTVMRMSDWRNDGTLNRATADLFPETPTPLLNLATYYYRFEHNPSKALGALDEAEERAPGFPPIRIRAEEIRRLSSRP